MKDMTVTMPLAEYNSMMQHIEVLKKQSIKNFTKRNYTNFKENEYTIEVDVEGIKRKYEDL